MEPLNLKPLCVQLVLRTVLERPDLAKLVKVYEAMAKIARPSGKLVSRGLSQHLRSLWRSAVSVSATGRG